jgi:hypothetical protein
MPNRFGWGAPGALALAIAGCSDFKGGAVACASSAVAIRCGLGAGSVDCAGTF